MKSLEDFVSRDAELVLGLVGPVGTEMDKFVDKVKTGLKPYSYRGNVIRLSDLAAKLSRSQPLLDEAEFDRRVRLMDAGDALRARLPEVLALAAAHTISEGRSRGSRDEPEPLPRAAHLLRSLKHPAEVLALRRIYGPGFFLIGVVSTSEERRQLLETEKGCSSAQIDSLFKRDEYGGESGQRTRDTFQLSDVFIRAEDAKALDRFFGLVFGTPHETPQPDEHAMFLAFSAALRSADLSRQVGAVVTSVSGDVLAIGMNDVPVAGGGLCWPGVEDHRDHVLGYDTNEQRRTKIVEELLEALRPEKEDAEVWKKRGWDVVRKQESGVMDITEYGRAVHAEMEALLSCARNGISTRGATLYSTTFPCHNCAKHIIAAGVHRVVYVEPYPKSQAKDFYGEMIDLVGATAPAGTSGPKRSSREEASARVRFEPFVGVGPRRFFDLFSLGLSSGQAVKRKIEGGKKRAWIPSEGAVRVPLLSNSYLMREGYASELLAAFKLQGESHDE